MQPVGALPLTTLECLFRHKCTEWFVAPREDLITGTWKSLPPALERLMETNMTCKQKGFLSHSEDYTTPAVISGPVPFEAIFSDSFLQFRNAPESQTCAYSQVLTVQAVTRNCSRSCRAPLLGWHRHFPTQSDFLQSSKLGDLSVFLLSGLPPLISLLRYGWTPFLLHVGLETSAEWEHWGMDREVINKPKETLSTFTVVKQRMSDNFQSQGMLWLAQGNTGQSWELLLLHLTADNTYQTQSKHVNAA